MPDPSKPPSEVTTGLRSVFSLAPIYKAAQWAVGAPRFRQTVVYELVKVGPGERVLDIGCGTADILAHLPDTVRYVGIDHSPNYIAWARKRFGDRGRFVDGSSGDVQIEAGAFDVVMAIGVLHHLDDSEVRDLLRSAHEGLAPGGRFISVDPTLVDSQSRIARTMIEHDRGRHVRRPPVVGDMIRSVFGSAEVAVRTDLLRIPYTHVTVTAVR